MYDSTVRTRCPHCGVLCAEVVTEATATAPEENWDACLAKLLTFCYHCGGRLLQNRTEQTLATDADVVEDANVKEGEVEGESEGNHTMCASMRLASTQLQGIETASSLFPLLHMRRSLLPDGTAGAACSLHAHSSGAQRGGGGAITARKQAAVSRLLNERATLLERLAAVETELQRLGASETMMQDASLHEAAKTMTAPHQPGKASHAVAVLRSGSSSTARSHQHDRQQHKRSHRSPRPATSGGARLRTHDTSRTFELQQALLDQL